jgi:hypothetical protein
MMKRVRRITQSPLNKLRWCLELECGHDVWITKGYRPLMHSANCIKCDVDRLTNDPKAIEKLSDELFEVMSQK